MARYLVVCHLTGESVELRSELRSICERDPAAEFTVLVPATPRSYWKSWDDLKEMERAAGLAERIGAMLRNHGFRVTREAAGSREPLLAIEDELRNASRYAEVVISTLPPRTSRWLRRDLINRAQERFGIPIRHVIARGIEAPPEPDMLGDDFAVEHELAGFAAPGGRQAQPNSVQKGRRPPVASPPSGQRIFPAAGSQAAAAPASGGGAGVSVVERQVETEAVAMDVTPTVLAVTLARNPAIADAFWSLQMQLEARSGLEPELGELVALRVAQLRQFTQLWQEHVLIARALGIAGERISAIEHWSSAEHVRFNDRERAVLGYVDAICNEGSGLDGPRRRVSQYLDDIQLIGLTLLVGFYRMSGSFAHALALDTDGPFVGWTLFRGPAEGPHL